MEEREEMKEAEDSVQSIEELKTKKEEYRRMGLEAEMLSQALKEESEEMERQSEEMKQRKEEMARRRSVLRRRRDEMVRKGLLVDKWIEDLLKGDRAEPSGDESLTGETGDGRPRTDGEFPSDGEETAVGGQGAMEPGGPGDASRERYGEVGERVETLEDPGGFLRTGEGESWETSGEGEGSRLQTLGRGSGDLGPEGRAVDGAQLDALERGREGTAGGEGDEEAFGTEGRAGRDAEGSGSFADGTQGGRSSAAAGAEGDSPSRRGSVSHECEETWSQLRTSEFSRSLMEILRVLMVEQTPKLVHGLVQMINDGAEEIARENADEERDWKKFGEAYQRVMLRHGREMGEDFQKKVLEKSYLLAAETLEIPDNFNSEFGRIAEEEYENLTEEFKRVMASESTRLLEGKFSEISIVDPCILHSDVGKRTLAIIKPDAYAYANEIIYQIQRYGFVVVQERRITLTPEQASLFYGEHLSKGFAQRLIEHMSSGPIVVLCLASAHCPSTIDAWREVMGPTDVAEAAAIFPRTLRAKYGDPNDQVRNAFHGSHSLEEAEREIHFFFPNIILDPLPNIEDISTILDPKSQQALHSAIVMLCKEKPPNSLAWFAHWLKHNVPGGASKSTDWKPAVHSVK